jgi:uncharacterized MAPEG superfamily protein
MTFDLSRPEILWLSLSTVAVALMWVPHILQLIAQERLFAAVWDPSREVPHNAAWAQRARRAHLNAVENIAVFAPLVLVALLTGRTGEATAVATAVFFFARLGHFVAYALAIPAARVILFLVGWAATMTVALAVFGLV